ncbi:M48 family metallopeptidase [Sandaracinus amylolyticus]|uniref:Peptidase M48 domain-containing protein n=1 Tax=Sandaracinus amylolyticus TaxID=927083 RepID=A0A0F6SFI7_9BACT|nr:M48 family metallopeptidase [Sandaracinus amylolyticus]AKF07014.1 hypothetical protein DB32_004163 [Sandaracinus amylolyticus]
MGEVIPIEEALARPIGSLVLCALVPLFTAWVMWVVLVRRLPDDRREEARAVAPFRSAAFVVGIVQIQLAWMLGATALGPRFVDAPGTIAAELFGAVCAIVAFCAGGVGRLIEERSRTWRDVRETIALRLRIVPFVGGPIVAAGLASRLPVVDGDAVRWEVVALAFVVVALGAMFGGLALSVATRAMVPASDSVRAIALAAAEAEGVRLAGVLRMPTTRLANAAAIPWARTMIVTDRIVALLTPSELRAVLAHEAGHLSEGPWVASARLGTAITLIFVLTTGVRIGSALHPDGALIAIALGIVIAVPGILLVRRLARRMEERADARARSTSGSAALADALTKIHEDARAPMTTGARRVHPDLYDRLVACGRDPGPRPAPPRTRVGTIVGLAIGAGLVTTFLLVEHVTAIAIDDAPLAGDAWTRLRIDPWDSTAMLASAWETRRDEDLDRAARELDLAAWMGAPRANVLELEAELAAARGDCASARARFDEALRERSRVAYDDPWRPLELGGWHLPPTLVTECGYGADDPPRE